MTTAKVFLVAAIYLWIGVETTAFGGWVVGVAFGGAVTFVAALSAAYAWGERDAQTTRVPEPRSGEERTR